MRGAVLFMLYSYSFYIHIRLNTVLFIQMLFYYYLAPFNLMSKRVIPHIVFNIFHPIILINDPDKKSFVTQCN